ncbi:MAG TPA: phosphate signaling complex protein PhoU [Leptospiraceae bacterium]|jgi:phosphate transport system protein|nr:phosphate signaling complex protein PhoU [Leptospirales bacterium]HMW59729.1 phosphate signaling complex protein PhoU [Leptospiraceae bacterium]HMX57036.1 phosphate signaling complex protein PhoU [Leptospiraceae bacterium]HMY44653.1 phosphate signaling complex protein PhoU [Leptospiraceae bacterium]HMZ35519.1 phosphate signaling complex protein PhoU [Leptospiraceae bacterium]
MLLDTKLKELRTEVAIMARRAEAMLEKATDLLHAPTEEGVKEVLAMDATLNDLEIKMDDLCMRILALDEPYANDFRFVFSLIKTTRDLERIGDESKTVAKWSQRITGEVPPRLLELGKKARETLNAAIHCLVNSDVSLTGTVMDLELTTDELEDEIINANPSIPIAFIAKALERVGDLSANIAENVVFSVKAEEIRHKT